MEMKNRPKENVNGATLLEGLNPEQRLAVVTTEGPELIVAGAGSGKTSVLTRRIAYLILEQGVPVHRLLAITFTNKAAREMRDRIRKLVGKIAEDLWMGTFHSICVRILRRESERLGFTSSFSILDSSDQRTLVEQSMLDLNYDLKKFDSYSVLASISRWKNELLESAPKGLKKTSLMDSVAADVFSVYQKRLRHANAMDFDDLIGHTVRLLENDEAVRQKYQEKFEYIHVDEYQDTNHAQYRLVRLLADKHRNLCVVGDSDQAIYAWRGADIENILRFERDYPEANVITLETNYRSTKLILDAANGVIRNNERRKEKNLVSVHGIGQPIKVVALSGASDEAKFVATEIASYVEEGNSPADCAVLYRANAQSRAVEEALLERAIPYTIVGGLTFYDRREIKDVFAYLKVLANPQDEISLLRIINTPKRGIGASSVTKLLDFAHEENITLYEALGRAREANLPEKGAESARLFFELLEELHAWMEGMPVTEFVGEVLHATGYEAMYRESNKSEDQQRLENISELFTVTQSFDRRRGGSLLEFLAEVSLLSDVDKEKGKNRESVKLMTLHASKGLEFKAVFIIGLEEGIFPHARSLEEAESGVEEERNLCYVGITRAMQSLYLTYCQERTLYGASSMRDPSRFLAELPASCIERIDLASGGDFEPQVGGRIRHPQHGEGIILGVSEKADGQSQELEMFLEVMFHPAVGVKTVPRRHVRPA